MSASSNLFSNILARYTRPRGYVASGGGGDDNNNSSSNNHNNVDSNDSLTFEMDSKDWTVAHAQIFMSLYGWS